MDTVTFDVLVVGASLGGVAAALAAAKPHVSVGLLAESEWVGGQLTEQGVCVPDENSWIESGGCTLTYGIVRQSIRDYYRSHYQLAPIAKGQPDFNIGNSWAGEGFSTEAKVADDILKEMLRSAGVRLIVNHTVVTCEANKSNNRLIAVIAKDGSEIHTRYEFQYILDATDVGGLLALANVEHVAGAKSYSMTGEPKTPAEPHPEWSQAITFPFAVAWQESGMYTIPISSHYNEMKVLQKYTYKDGLIDGTSNFVHFGDLSWWTYRRVIDSSMFASGFDVDVALVNNNANDYQGGSLPPTPPARVDDVLTAAREASLGFLFWMQTECPHDPDHPEKRGYPNLQPLPDFFGTSDAVAPKPYIRESRRIKALRTVLFQDIGRAYQPGPRAAFFADSCGIGSYAIDMHPSSAKMPIVSASTYPFQIPLGSLIPVRMTNLLAASKNLGVTHITNSAYRVHHIEWNIGESAGTLAAQCCRRNRDPSVIYGDTAELRLYQSVLLKSGVPLYWWADVPPWDACFYAAQRLAMDRLIPGGTDLNFRPGDPISASEKSLWEGRIGVTLDWTTEDLTRSLAVRRVATQLGIT